MPLRWEVPRSKGTPTKQASRPAAVLAAGRRIMVVGPPKRGISLPPRGWFMLFRFPEGSEVPPWGTLATDFGGLELQPDPPSPVDPI